MIFYFRIIEFFVVPYSDHKKTIKCEEVMETIFLLN
jgi:hypothetical protein